MPAAEQSVAQPIDAAKAAQEKSESESHTQALHAEAYDFSPGAAVSAVATEEVGAKDTATKNLPTVELTQKLPEKHHWYDGITAVAEGAVDEFKNHPIQLLENVAIGAAVTAGAIGLAAISAPVAVAVGAVGLAGAAIGGAQLLSNLPKWSNEMSTLAAPEEHSQAEVDAARKDLHNLGGQTAETAAGFVGGGLTAGLGTAAIRSGVAALTADTAATEATIVSSTNVYDALPAPAQRLALPAPEAKPLLPGPDSLPALPAPGETLALPAPQERLALPAPERQLLLPSPEKMPPLPAPEAPPPTPLPKSDVLNVLPSLSIDAEAAAAAEQAQSAAAAEQSQAAAAVEQTQAPAAVAAEIEAPAAVEAAVEKNAVPDVLERPTERISVLDSVEGTPYEVYNHKYVHTSEPVHVQRIFEPVTFVNKRGVMQTGDEYDFFVTNVRTGEQNIMDRESFLQRYERAPWQRSGLVNRYEKIQPNSGDSDFEPITNAQFLMGETVVDTLEGPVKGYYGDFLVTDVHGEPRVVPNEVFRKMYRIV